ncbi:MAG: Na+/H+ antiporter NhaC family protein, partial [Phaeodactylibacter sp.]|nr:Na+/H+ antiporter NhaC family protein [Phaeodactylibacter sp.]
GMAATYRELLAANIDVASQSWGDIWRGTGQLLGADSGFFMKIGKLIGNSDSYTALLWASLSGVAVAVALTIGARIMKLAETISTMITGFKAMLPALLILTMAWSLAATTEELHTATFLTFALQDSVNPFVMPMIIFVLAALISFSTGSSWSTMAILYPIAIPTTWAICQAQGIAPGLSMEVLLNVISVTLAASVLGDHCSPISDTTILSSLASDCNHIDHVRTQLPYALTVGGVSLAAAGLSTYLGGGWGICGILLLGSLAVLFLIVWRFGKQVDA